MTDLKVKLTSLATASSLAVTDLIYAAINPGSTPAPRKVTVATLANAVRSALGLREVLSANRTYYVRTDGNDSNTGLVNNAGGAFLTIQKAVDTAATLDTSIYDITIQVADGTYIGNCSCKNIIGSGIVTIQGNAGTPSNVIIDGGFMKITPGTQYYIKNLLLEKVSGTAVFAINATNGSYLDLNNIVFASNGFTVHIGSDSKATVNISGNYSITGAASYHLYTLGGSLVNCINRTITITGTPAFSNYFNFCAYNSTQMIYGNTYSGAATGTRYYSFMNSVIYINAAGNATYFPGNVAGLSANGGQYL